MAADNFLVQIDPAGDKIEAREGSSLLEVIRRAGYRLNTECGGQGTCRRCKVRLLAGDVFTVGQANLTAKEREQHYILACLARIVGPLKIEIPPKSQFSLHPEALRPELSPGEHPGKEVRALHLALAPLVRQLHLKVAAPNLQDNSSDYDRLSRALNKAGIAGFPLASLDILRKLSRSLRQGDGRLWVALTQESGMPEILELDVSAPKKLCGLAVDIGTTTLFMRLLDLHSGEVLAEASDFNWQIPCGADIIHRIVYAGKPGGLQELHRLALEATDSLLQDLLKQAGVASNHVVCSVVAGNATMEHLFLGMDPVTIREAPYVPTVSHFPMLRARDIGMNICPHAPVMVSPSVASYVGGDITAGLLAAGVHHSEKLCLYVDLGTNGEIALGNSEWLTACACSAGPAFEGGGVHCGMRALPGAIDQVRADATSGSLLYRVIGGASPCGICGSGLIDLLSELRATERITARGRFNFEADPARIRQIGRRGEFLLVDAAETDNDSPICINEADLDNLIRTKGAIFAGIMTLLKGVGLELSAIERVVIAGGFGRYLDIERAIRIGMLPDLPRDQFEYIGNGSLRGAGLALLSEQLRRELDEIARRITYFELSTWPGYMDEFMAALFLPHTDLSLFPSLAKSKAK